MVASNHKSPVDQGWAWVVLACSFLTLAISATFTYSVGIFNVVFLETFGASRATTSWIGSLTIGMLSTTGPLCSLAIERFGMRRTMLFGGVLCTCSTFISAWSTHVVHVIIGLGLMSSVGHGLTYGPAILSIGFYFKKYRNLAFGLSSVGIGVGMFVSPFILEYLLRQTSWRATLIYLSGLYLHYCVFGALLRPVLQQAAADDLYDEHEQADGRVGEARKSTKSVCSVSFVTFCLSLFSVSMGVACVHVHLVAYCRAQGAGGSEAALYPSVIGGFSLLNRLLIGVSSNDPQVDINVLYIGTNGIAGFCTLLFPLLASSYVGRMSYAALFGFYSASHNVLISPMTIELLGLANFNWGWGIGSVVCGIALIVGPPLTGWLFDITQSYTASFYVAGSVLASSSLIVMAIPVIRSREKDNIQVKRQSKDIHLEPMNNNA